MIPFGLDEELGLAEAEMAEAAEAASAAWSHRRYEQALLERSRQRAAAATVARLERERNAAQEVRSCM